MSKLPKFAADFKAGASAEDFTCAYLAQWYPKTHRVEGKNKYYDIKVPEVNKTVEVKYDRISKKTGNIGVELSYYGKPSGLTTTKANHWVYFFYNEGWGFMFLPPKKLLKLAQQCYTVKGGDNNASLLALIPIKKLLPLGSFHLIRGLN